MSPLGRQIDRLRREKGWNWKELGRRAKMHPQTIYKIVHSERLDPRVSAVVRLAMAFDVSVNTLLDPLEDFLPKTDDDDAHAA